MVAVRRASHEGLWHERRNEAVLASHDPAKLSVGVEVVYIGEWRTRGLIHLDLGLVLRVGVRDRETHAASVFDQVEQDRLPLLEVGDFVKREWIRGVCELTALF